MENIIPRHRHAASGAALFGLASPERFASLATDEVALSPEAWTKRTLCIRAPEPGCLVAVFVYLPETPGTRLWVDDARFGPSKLPR